MNYNREGALPGRLSHLRLRHRMIESAAALAIMTVGCNRTTSKLSTAAEQQYAAEGIVRKADEVTFRYTHDLGRREGGWEDRRASIIVTRQSLLIHKNEKVGLEITPRTRRYVDVVRDGARLRIRAGSGGSQEVWSFVPESDAAGWAADIRAVTRASKTSANR